MTVRRIIASVLGGVSLAAAACNSAAQPDGRANQEASATGLPHSADFVLGVQTHFGQNWDRNRFDQVRELDIGHFRDGISWQAAERNPGRIVIPPARLELFRSACHEGRRMLLTIVPRHPLYEDDRIVATPEGQAAFLSYLEALIDALPGCIDAFEIGNEINTSGALPVAEGADGRDVYVELLKAIYEPLKRKAPEIAILGGSTNVIGTGFLNGLFERSMLDYVDGIVVHPFRSHGENVDWELRRLAEVMASHGKSVPVWATEFSDNFDTAEEAAPALLKMTTMLGASGVERAYWYALIDQRWFRHMGLFTASGGRKPGAQAMMFLQDEILPHGRPENVSPDRLTSLYRYGEDRWVVWGAPRPLHVADGTRVHDARGRELRGEMTVGTAPVVVIGERPTLGASAIVADSLLEFGGAPWGYFAEQPDGRESELGPLDEQYATRFGSRYLRPLFIADKSGAVVGTRADPTSAILRYTVAEAADARLQVCLIPGSRSSGIAVEARTNDTSVAAASLTRPGEVTSEMLRLESGQTIDFVFTPAGDSGSGNTFNYRIRLIRDGAALPACPPNGGGWIDP